MTSAVQGPTDDGVLVEHFRADDPRTALLGGLRWRWRVLERGEEGLAREEFIARFTDWAMRQSPTHHGFLVTANDAPVAGAWLAVIERPPGPTMRVRRSGIVMSVYVEPEFRNAGVGTDLINGLIDEARRLELEYLMVHPSSRSFPFYERLGFANNEGLLELRFASQG